MAGNTGSPSNLGLKRAQCLWSQIRDKFLVHLKEVMKWRPPGIRKRGRPKLTWAEGIRGLMREKGLMEEDWNDRREWRKKII